MKTVKSRLLALSATFILVVLTCTCVLFGVSAEDSTLSPSMEVTYEKGDWSTPGALTIMLDAKELAKAYRDEEINRAALLEAAFSQFDVDMLPDLLPTEVLNEYITPEFVQAIIDDASFLDKTDVTGLQELLTGDDWLAIINRAEIEDLMEDDAVAEILLTDAVLHLFATDEVLDAYLTEERLKYFDNHADEIAVVLTEEEIKDLLEGVDPELLLTLTDPENPTVTELLEKGIVTADSIRDKISVEDMRFLLSEGLIDAAAFLDLVDTGDLVDAVPPEAIAEVISLVEPETLRDLINVGALLDCITVEELFEHTDVQGIIDTVDHELLLQQIRPLATSILMEATDKITVNGTKIFENDRFDANALVTVARDMLPKVVETLKQTPPAADGIVATFEVTATMGPYLEDVSLNVAFGIKDESGAIREKIARALQYVEVEVDGGGMIFMDIAVPPAVASMIENGLDYSAIPADLRNDILAAMDLPIHVDTDEEKGLVALLETLTKEDLQAIINAVDADALEERAPEAMGAYRRLQDGEYLDTVLRGMKASARVLNALTGRYSGQVPSYFYHDDGHFEIDSAFEFDLGTAIEKVPALSALGNVLTNTVITQPIEIKAEVGGLHQLTYVDASGETLYTVYLPAGVDLSLIDDVPQLAGHGLEGWSTSTVGQPVLTMPSYDIVLYEIAAGQPETFYVEFYAGNKLIKRYPYTLDNYQTIVAPSIPAKQHYNTVGWEAYDLSNGGHKRVYAQYTPKQYTVTFMADGVQVGQPIPYTIETESITPPTVPPKDHYDGAWEFFRLRDGGNITVNAVYTPKTYTLTFMADGVQVGDPVRYTVETETIRMPEVPQKEHYEGSWPAFDLREGGNRTIHAVYIPIKYTVTFKADGVTVGEPIEYTVQTADAVTPPTVPAKDHYNGAWEDYELEYTEDQVVNAVYTPKTYTLTFMADGAQVGLPIEYTIETVNSVVLPTVPAKDHYNGAWEDFVLEYTEDQVVNAVYTAITYTLIFKADGVQVGLPVEYTVETGILTLPAVPEKQHYNGTWEAFIFEYTVGQVVDAVYTPKQYTVTFKVNGVTVPNGVVTYTYGDTRVTEPAFPQREYYTAKWEDYVLENTTTQVVNAVYTPITYYVTFMADGKQVGEPRGFTVENLYVTAPDVPHKIHYKDGVWESYTLVAGKNIVVKALYTPVVYTITFVAGDDVVLSLPYTVEDESVEEPPVPVMAHHTASAWSSYDLSAGGNLTVYAKYTPITYYLTFYAGDVQLGARVPYTVETKNVTLPAIPAKEHYVGSWPTLDLAKGGDRDIQVVYTPVTYYLTFMAEGVQVGNPLPYNVETESLALPEIPAKEGYVGKWPAINFALGGDRAVHATYEVAPEEPAETLWWSIVLSAILALGLIAVIILIIFRRHKDGDETPPSDQGPLGGPDTDAEDADGAEDKDEDEDEDENENEGEDLLVSEDQSEAEEATVPETPATEAHPHMSTAKVLAKIRTLIAAAGKIAIVDIAALDDFFENGDTVDVETLKEKELISLHAKRIKVIGNAKLTKAYHVHAHNYSKGAKEAIEQAGGDAHRIQTHREH